MKPKFGMYDLHKLQGQFTGVQFLILDLKICIDLLSFISFGIVSQIFGAKCEIVFKPYFVVWGILETSEYLLRRQYFVSFTLNNSDIRDDDELFRALYISTASCCKFLLCILTDPDFLSRSSKVPFHEFYLLASGHISMGSSQIVT